MSLHSPPADATLACAVDAARRCHERVLRWYDEHARDLPWRAPDATPVGVLVSEAMLQQTPVARVLPVWLAWMERWPTPADLAAAGPGEAVRAWGRLGYPRRALRLHAAAAAIVERHGGEVPDDHAALRGPAGRRATTPRAPSPPSPSAAATSCSTPTSGASSARRRRRRAAARPLGRPGPSATARPRSSPSEPADGRGLGGRGHGARRPGVPGDGTPAATRCPVSERLRLARRRAGRRRPACAGSSGTPAPTGSAAAGCWRSCATDPARSTSPRSRRPGPSRCSGSGAWPRCSTTASWSRRPRASTPCPDRLPRPAIAATALGEVVDRLLDRRGVPVERQVEVEPHERRVEEDDARPRTVRRAPGARRNATSAATHALVRRPAPRRRTAPGRAARAPPPRRRAAGTARAARCVSASQSEPDRTRRRRRRRAAPHLGTDRSLATRRTVATRSSLSAKW